MLQQKDAAKPVSLWGFIVGVEIVEGGSTSPEQVALRLADSLSFMEGIGKVDVDTLGIADEYTGPEAPLVLTEEDKELLAD